MAAVRYAALVTLVIWIASLLFVVARDALEPAATSLVCGGIVLLCLLVMKFVGPPPRAFLPRLMLVSLMVVAAILASLSRVRAATAAEFNVVLAAILLAWYVHE